MKKTKPKIVSFISVLMLLIFAILFIHSELGIASKQSTIHSDPDFCELASNSTRVNSQNSDTLKFYFISPNSFVIALTQNLFTNSSCFSLITPFVPFLTNASKLSLLNTLLI